MDVFGPVIDQYNMTDAVKDGITVRLVYDGRPARATLDDSKVQEIEKYYKQCLDAGSNEYQIEASKKAVKVNVYPNPATVSFSVAGAENSKVSVYDIAGRLVLTSDKASNVSVAGLAKGVYKVIVNGEAGRQAASLIVK